MPVKFRKTYYWPGQGPVKKIGETPFAVTTDTKGTCFDGNSCDKICNTAPHKARFKTLKTLGKAAFRRSFK